MQTGVPSTGRLGVAQALDELDLGALGRSLWRKKLLIGLLTLAAAGLALFAVSVITPRYKSEARVLIEPRENIFLRPDADKTAFDRSAVDQDLVTSQVQLVLSRDLALDIIRKLKLGDRPEFDPVLQGPSLTRTLLGLIGIGKDPMTETPEERVLKSYYARLNAFQVEKSRVIAIEFESQDPGLAARAANAIAEGYLVLQQTAKQEQTRSASQWLSGEIDNLTKKVADAEAKVETYRAKTNLFVGTNNTMLSNQQLGDFNAQLAAARAQKSDAESKARVIREILRTGAPVEFSDIINSELMRRLSEQRVTLRAQLAEQSSTLLDQHPRIKELKAQIADLERQLRLEADRLARSLENDAKFADAKVKALSENLDQLKRQASTTNEQDVQLRALDRDAKSQRDLLESYLAKYREATARDNIGAASPEARIISRALVSNTPSWPKKVPTILIAAFGTFALSAGFILSGELMRAATPQPVPFEAAGAPPAAPAAPVARPARTAWWRRKPARSLDAAVAAVTRDTAAEKAAKHAEPVAEATAEAAAARLIAGVSTEAIEGLAREIGMAGDAARRITVVGARRNVGATLAAITLARRLAKEGRVVLLDFTVGSPNLSVIAADPTAPGLSELVQGAASFGDIISRDRFSRVHVINAGRAPTDASGLLSSQRLTITLEALARSYDYVVLDAGALPDVSAEPFAKLAPRAVLVVSGPDDPGTTAGRERLLAAGFASVSVLAGAPRGPQSGLASARAAA